MASQIECFTLKKKIWDKLILLKDDLSRSYEPEISANYLAAHGIEHHCNAHLTRTHTGNIVKAQPSPVFATLLSSKVTDEAFENAYKDEEQPGWPAPLDLSQRHLDFLDPTVDYRCVEIRHPYFIALKMGESLLSYRTHLDWEKEIFSWDTMGYTALHSWLLSMD